MEKCQPSPFIMKQREHICIILFYNVNNRFHVSGDGAAVVVEDLVHEEPHVSQLRI